MKKYFSSHISSRAFICARPEKFQPSRFIGWWWWWMYVVSCWELLNCRIFKFCCEVSQTLHTGAHGKLILHHLLNGPQLLNLIIKKYFLKWFCLSAPICARPVKFQLPRTTGWWIDSSSKAPFIFWSIYALLLTCYKISYVIIKKLSLDIQNIIFYDTDKWFSGTSILILDNIYLIYLMLEQSESMKIRGAKNVPSSCTQLGPAQVMEVIIIGV